jgi:hypothetical protein
VQSFAKWQTRTNSARRSDDQQRPRKAERPAKAAIERHIHRHKPKIAEIRQLSIKPSLGLLRQILRRRRRNARPRMPQFFGPRPDRRPGVRLAAVPALPQVPTPSRLPGPNEGLGGAQNLVHFSALGEFIHELVQIADLSC